MSRSNPLAIAIVILMLFASGCGGGHDSVTGSDSQSRARVIDEGDAICAMADEAQGDAVRRYVSKHPKAQASKAQEAKMVEVAGLPPIAVEAEELAGLDVPSEDEAEIKEIVKGIETALRRAEEDPASVLDGQGNPFNGVGELAAKYGFKICKDAL